MNEPKVIFLQVGDDYDPQTDNFNELDVTWCSDNIDETDIEYCRITAAELAALREAVEALREALKQAKWCIDEMAYFAHDLDISDAEALRKIKHAWMQISVVKIDELLKGDTP